MRSGTWVARVAGSALALCLAVTGAWGQAVAPERLPYVPFSPATASFVILPGKAIGQWNLDARITDLVAQFEAQYPTIGTVPVVFRQAVFSFHQWTDPPLIAASPRGFVSVWALGTYGPKYRTPENFGEGSTVDQIAAVYKDPDYTVRGITYEVLIYNSRGIAFDTPWDPATNNYGTVVRTTWVFRVGEAQSIFNIP